MKNIIIGLLLLVVTTAASAKDIGDGWDLSYDAILGIPFVSLSKDGGNGMAMFSWNYLTDEIDVTFYRDDDDPIVWFMEMRVDGKRLANSEACYKIQTECINNEDGYVEMPLIDDDVEPLISGTYLEVIYQTKDSQSRDSYYTSKVSLVGSKNALSQMGLLIKALKEKINE